MRKEDCLDMLQRIPLEVHQQVNLILRNSFMLTIDTVVRYEPTYLVFRGREGGTTDEGRAFFVPYDEISYIKIEKVVRIGELKSMYGETGYVDAEDRLSAKDAADAASAATLTKTPAPLAEAVATDPASIAKQNLLNRIRAARANVAGATGKLTGSGNK